MAGSFSNDFSSAFDVVVTGISQPPYVVATSIYQPIAATSIYTRIAATTTFNEEA